MYTAPQEETPPPGAGAYVDFLTVIFIAIGLAMDALAVSLGIGTTQYANGRRPIFRLSFHFGLFQFLMPVIGWLGGLSIQSFIADFDHWIAFGLLAFVGGRMIRSGLNSESESHASDPSRGGMLVLLSIAVSIDALAIGLSLAVIQVNVLYPAVIIGIVTGLLSLIGLRVGGRLGQAFGKRMEIIGGVILLAIGLRVLISHLFGVG
jgi:putative Mn2+ efflux pump MntP